jgi:hypothetical protein
MKDIIKASGDQTPVANPIEVQKFLKGVDYPASKEKLVDVADQEGANDTVIRTLQKLPLEFFTAPIQVSHWIAWV